MCTHSLSCAFELYKAKSHRRSACCRTCSLDRLGAFVIFLLQLNGKQAFHQAEALRIANPTLGLCEWKTKLVKLKHKAESELRCSSLSSVFANEREGFASLVWKNLKPKTL